ncbi:metal-dependent hydrolase, partial [Methanoregula sp.]|uniref:metal-dependent hydrolase n=1 Tax=Methanoregula sp. TaxID=2052170 RepID=UPI0025FA4C28
MLTRHHLALALMTGGILWTTENITGITGIFLICGICLGAILPDIHMKQPSAIRLLSVAWCIVSITRITIIPALSGLYSLLFGIPVNTSDKRLTHSLPGIVLFTLLFTGALFVLSSLVPVSGAWPLFLHLSAGVFTGLAIHLVHDLCCRKGIALFYPFSETILHGSIRPCDVYDFRISRFHIQHVLIFVVCQIVVVAAVLPGDVSSAAGIAGAFFSLLVMVLQSEVRPGRDEGRRSLEEESLAT